MSIQSSSSSTAALLLGFAAGATCASIALQSGALGQRRRQQQSNLACEKDSDQKEANVDKHGSSLPSTTRTEVSSFLWRHWQQWLWFPVDKSVQSSSHHIGELTTVRRRTRWPWDRRQHRSDSASVNSTDSNSKNHADSLHVDYGDTSLSETSMNESLSVSTNNNHHGPCMGTTPDQKSDFCIGSIFGLDVGGTLAKLVYFEQTPEHALAASEGLDHRRERWYRHSASARAVLLARRGNDQEYGEVEDLISHGHGRSSPRRERAASMQHSKASEEDLKALSRLRQESVPDDLAAYAQSTSLYGFYTTDSLDHMAKQHQLNGPMGVKNDMTSRNGKPDVLSSVQLRKVRSMLDLNHASSSQHYNEALDRFYNFARRIDSYREGVKDHKLSFYSRKLGGEFHFIRFETRRMANAMDLIRANQLHLNIRQMGATGGGAHKYANLWKEELGIDIVKQDEMDSLVAGMQFVLATVVGECYTYRPPGTNGGLSRASSMQSSFDDDFHISGVPLEGEDASDSHGSGDDFQGRQVSNPSKDDSGKGDEWWYSKKVQRDSISQASSYPYLLVSIGTGVSFLRVDGPRKHVRVSGSTIGGGTYWGLIRLLTDIEDFETVIRLAERGDPSKLDLMIGDIYGNKPEVLLKMGLAPDLVASSFGKLIAKEDPASGIKEEDIARALLLMITINIGQVAYLNAQLHKTSRIYFVGNFLRSNSISQKRLSYAIDYWSKGEMEALFLEHEGYFGALGAFLLSQNIPHEASPRRAMQESMPTNMDLFDGNGPNPPLYQRSHTFGSL